MEPLTTVTGSAMRSVVSAFQAPVVIVLLVGIVFIVVMLGILIGEYVSEHRHFNVALPRLVDDLRASGNGTAQDTRTVVAESGLLLRQKHLLIELTQHPAVTPEMRESLAVGLEYKEQRRYDSIVKVTDIVSRIAPLVGLLGTLIPLGPGILALSSGDTETLSASLLTAFDTTSLGLIIAAFALIISAIRKRWYKDYMVSFDAAMECILEVEKIRSILALRHVGGAQGSDISSAPFYANETASRQTGSISTSASKSAYSTSGVVSTPQKPHQPVSTSQRSYQSENTVDEPVRFDETAKSGESGRI